MSSSQSPRDFGKRRNWSSINQWLLWIGLAAAVAWLSVGHGEHLFRLAPLLILLACPLMHVFGHGHGSGHGDHSHRQRGEPLENGQPPTKPEQPGGHVH
ncbi:hypothetical protein BURC_04848 [Burkholderiaceae bacterium]|nr:hypothetical protein BURC_04848 [Burkholderiaceae bacterium]